MKKMLGFSIILTLMTSCLNDFLEVEPLNNISTEIYWKSEKDVRSALNATYAHLQSAYKKGFLSWQEKRSDNFLGTLVGAYPTQNICFNKLDASLPECDWNDWYKMISIANYAIYYIPQMEGKMSKSKQNHLLSEAYFIRAFAYFSLYRIWGDAPLIDKPVLKKSDVSKPSQAPKHEIMKLITSDLELACGLVDNTQEGLFIYSPAALYALCTDVAMWNQDYDKAIDYSQQLYNLNKHTIAGVNFSLVCSDAETKDNIWTLKWQYAANGSNTFIGSYYNSSSPLIPTKVIYEKWQAWEDWSGQIDARRVATIDSARYSGYGTNHVNRRPASRIWKWTPGVAAIPEDLKEAYLPIYRLADIILLRAEALNKKERYQEAIDEMNRVRKRAGLTDKTLFEYLDAETFEINADSIENDILQERQFELFAEGKRWFDLMRTGKVLSVMNEHFNGYITNYGGKDFKVFTEEWQFYWPVSQNILNENENLKQTGNY